MPAIGESKRKLAAILSADVVGYSRLMGEDERATLDTLQQYRAAMARVIARHDGRVVNTAGDALLAEFQSAVEAVQGAIEVQHALEGRNQELPEHRRMHFRIGVNLGDVLAAEDGTLYGDGVNIAARLEGLAEGGGICVSGMVHNAVAGKLDCAFDDLGEQQVKNIAQPVRVYRVRTDARPAKAMPSVKAGRWRWWPWLAAAALTVAVVGVGLWLYRDLVERPPSAEAPPAVENRSIAVLPFGNLSGDPEQEYFADGLTEDISTALSRFKGLFVIARNSTFTYKGKAVDVREVGRALGVRYVMEGSVRKAGKQVRISAQLIDAASGAHVWAERYDRDLAGIFALQDEVTREIVAALKVEIGEGATRAAPARTANIEAYDFLLRGRAYMRRTTGESNALARHMFEKAIELDPNFAEPYAELSRVHFLDWFFQWSLDPLVRDRMLQAAQRAVVLDESLAFAHSRLAVALAYFKRWDEAIAEGERSFALDPASSEALTDFAYVLCLAGRYKDALSPAERAVRLDPKHFLPRNIAGYGYFFLGKYDAAEAAIKASLALNPNLPSAHRNLAATYVKTGRLAEAQAEVAEVLRLQPNASLAALPERIPFRDPAVLERYLATLAKAGYPP